MVNVRYNRGLVRIMDTYGTTMVDKEDDIDIHISAKVLFPTTRSDGQTAQKGVLQSYGRTLIIDLQRTEEEIFADIHKNAKYKINRAHKRDTIHYHELTTPTDEQIRQFITFFNSFAKYKDLPKGNFGRLTGLRDKGSLIISYMTDVDEHVLCYHAYLKTESYCSLLYSASARFENSQMRNLIGRANRYLHWQDIKSFRKMGHEWFDFGGLFVGADADDEKNINRFKMEFGGQVVDLDKKFYSLSLLGKITVFLFWFKMRKRPEFLRAKNMMRWEHVKH